MTIVFLLFYSIEVGILASVAFPGDFVGGLMFSLVMGVIAGVVTGLAEGKK